MWLDPVVSHYSGDLELRWKNFSLEQINATNGDSGKVWDEEDLTKTRSLLSSVAGEAARRQGKDAFDAFFLRLLTERHGGNRIPLNDIGLLVDLADDVGLDVKQFENDLRDPSLLTIVKDDHREATESHGIFGTPTFVFSNGQSAYLKTFIPPEDQGLETFEHFLGLFMERSYIGEVKRPQPPWPKGAL